jgi:3-oxo-5-alpha-steroid 4-dehydrogenase 1
MFRYVTSANYFGEFLEWVGFAVLTWSWAGAVFALWTFANLAPRAARIYDLYSREFPDELDTAKVKRMIPFIY